MIVKVTTAMDEEYQMELTVEVDGVKKFNVYDGELEDNSLGRNFNDCHKLPELMRLAYEAGVRGEAFEVENVEEGF